MKKKNNNLKDLIARLQRFQDWRRGKIEFDDFANPEKMKVTATSSRPIFTDVFVIICFAVISFSSFT